jgi:hypothetical protein
MKHRSQLVAAALAALAIAPVFAAGRPACCVKPPAAVVAHACCPAATEAHGAAPKGCCKAPGTRKSEARIEAAAPVAVAAASLEFAAPAASPVALSPAVSMRLARRAHHAEAPDDSPPDLLSHLHILLI